jgi:hypothetical protein
MSEKSHKTTTDASDVKHLKNNTKINEFGKKGIWKGNLQTKCKNFTG